MRPIGSLVLRTENPRVHTLEQIEQLSASMRRWGWTMPVLVDEESRVIAGHGRLRAARLMGFTEAPVVVCRGWSEDEKRAYVIADNQLASNSEWDAKKLRVELRALVASDFDVQLIGISDDDLQKLVLDPAEQPAGEPTDVHMKRCPTCGGLRRQTPEKS